jgi:pimeloyl-ACP methyl ester carboxylesterase
MEELRVTVGPWSIRYFAAGSGPAMILVHGLGVSAEYWRRAVPSLAASGFRVLAPDLPGFGRSTGPRRGLSVAKQAEAVLGFANALGIEEAVLVGHSLACQAVIEVAAAHPERVTRLVLASPTGARRRYPRLRQAFGLLIDIPREPLPLITLAARAYLRAGPRRLWGTWSEGVHQDPLATAPLVRAPTLILVGRRDPLVAPGFVNALAAAIPDARLRWIEGAAHAIIFDAPGEFVSAVLSRMSS